MVWINTHPSALLAPVLAAATLLIDLRRWMVAAASAVALLINPFGWRAITAPFELTKLVGSGEFVNAEWLPSSPALFPLLYITSAAVVVLFLISPDGRQHLWRAAIRPAHRSRDQHLRNQSLYSRHCHCSFRRFRRFLATLRSPARSRRSFRSAGYSRTTITRPGSIRAIFPFVRRRTSSFRETSTTSISSADISNGFSIRSGAL
jgi:hypothetical protein